MRLFSGTIVGVLLAGCLTYVTSSAVRADEIVSPPTQPVDVSTATIPAVPDQPSALAAEADDGADLVAELPARRTDEFGLVGVTWSSGFDTEGLLVEVRLRTDGTWSGWDELHVEVDDGSEGGRDGTEALWVGSADGVAVRVQTPTGERPPGLQVSTIDPGTSPAEATTSSASPAFYSGTAADATTIADGTPSYTARPAIISRSAWGAAKNTKCDSPITGNETRGVVVHHTAGTNSYSKAQSAAIVRATQAYHMKARKWCDVGYNFLVDKYGQIFEGRNGGVDKAVRAAHSGNAAVNTYTMGVSMMGTFSSSEPTAATKNAMVRLIGWRLGTTFHPAKGTYSLGGKTLNRIAGHRDVVGTECPGAAAYRWLGASGGLRDRVATYISRYSTPILSRYRQLGVGSTGPVYVGEYPFSSNGGGRKARMANIDVITSPKGTFWVRSYVRSRFNRTGGQTKVLGVPVANAVRTARSRVMLQRFEKGTIYRVKRPGKKHQAYALWGPVATKYRSLKEADGRLGAPKKTQTKISGGRQRVWFANGHITWQANGRVTAVVR